MEEMEIDEMELERQRKAELLNRDGVTRVEIIVTDNEDDIPYCNLMAHRVTPVEMAKLCYCMKTVMARIYSDHPEVKVIEKGMSSKTRHVAGTQDNLEEHLKQLRGEE